MIITIVCCGHLHNVLGSSVTIWCTVSAYAKPILFMLAVVFIFTVMDDLAKRLQLDIGLIPTLWTIYAEQAILVILIVSPRLMSVVKSQYPKLQLFRSVVLFMVTYLFFLSILKIDLAEATAITHVNLVLINLGAFLFLGGKIGPRRIIGILVPFYWQPFSLSSAIHIIFWKFLEWCHSSC